MRVVEDRQSKTYCTTARTLDRTKTYEHRGLTGRIGQDGSVGVFGCSIVVDFKMAISTRPASMHYALGNAFMVEVHNFLAP